MEDAVHAELATLAAEYWDHTLRTFPTEATLVGDHRFDDLIEDHSAEADADTLSALGGFRDRLAAIDPSELTGQDRVTARMLDHEILDRTRQLELAVVELRSDQMDSFHVGMLLAAPQMAAEAPEHADALVGRLSKLGTSLDQAAQRFRDGLARGRTPAALCVQRSLHSIDAYLGSALDDDLFVNLAGPTGWDGESAWREKLRRVVSDSVRPGYQRMRDVLAGELLPVARPDDRAGLCWLDDGEELYAAMLGSYTSLPVTAEVVHQLGLDHTAVLADEYRRLGDRALGTDDRAAIFARLRTDPDLRFRSADHIMDLAQDSLDRARRVVPEWFNRMPRADCRIEPVPEVLAADAPAAYYFPPTEDGSRPGTYFVNLRQPSEQIRYEAESVAFHEAIPGHHFQLTIATELDGIPAFRRLGFGNTAYIEGWALYTERLADEMGLYSDDIARLGMLSGDSLRSSRLVVDTGLHAKGWSRQQAIDHFLEHTPAALPDVEVEVDRYVAIPGQAVAYKVGQQEIVRLRDRARDVLGERFDIRSFHDVVLGSGGVTLPVLADLVEEWIADQTR